VKKLIHAPARVSSCADSFCSCGHESRREKLALNVEELPSEIYYIMLTNDCAVAGPNFIKQ